MTARISQAQRALLEALAGRTYPAAWEVLSPLLGDRWAKSVEALVRRGLIVRVVRQQGRPGEARSYEPMGYLLPPAGAQLVRERFGDLTWIPAYDAIAASEGWGIFNRETSTSIERDDEAGVLESDAAAWALVIAHARAGSVLHRSALQLVRRENPTVEWRAIVAAHPEAVAALEGR